MDEYGIGAEFGRFVSRYEADQTRNAARWDAGFGGLNDRLDELNGRTRKNSEGVASLDMWVESIKERGCAQIEAHRALFADAGIAPAPRSRKRDAVVAGSGAGLFVVFDLVLKWIGVKLGI